MSELYSNPTTNTPVSNRFRGYFRLTLAVLTVAMLVLVAGGTYAISTPEYSVYRMYQANINSSYSDLSSFIDIDDLANSIVDGQELDFEATGLDRDELVDEVSSKLIRDIRRDSQDRQFFDSRFNSFISYINNSDITMQDGKAITTASTSYGELEMVLERKNLRWVWTGLNNPDAIDIDDLVLELSDRPTQAQLGNLQVVDLEGNLLAAEELQITLNEYEILETLEAIPNSFLPSLPNRPATRYLLVNITAEYLGDGSEVLLAINVVDTEDESYEVYPVNAPISDDISGETLVSGVPVTGNLLFEIDQENEPVYLQYGNFFETRYRIRLDSANGEEEEVTEDEPESDKENQQQDASSSEGE